MRTKAFLALVIVILSLASCAKEGFSIEDVALKRNVYVTIDSENTVSYKENAVLSVLQNKDNTLPFLLKSPDGDLVWEGKVSGRRATSEDLQITPGASFPAGEYNVVFYGEDGSDITKSVELPAVDQDFMLIKDKKLTLSYDAEVVASGDKKSLETGEEYLLPEGVESVVIQYKDRFLNTIEIKQNF